MTSEAVPFVYLVSVCRSLQCLISALTQAGGGGLLFSFSSSVLLQGGRGAADKCHWHVWGALAVFRPHWVCPGLWCVLSPSILLRLLAALQGVGPELCALPRPKPLRFRFLCTPQRRRLGWACVLCLPHPSSSGSQETDKRTLPGCGAPSPLRGPSLSALCLFWELDSSCDPPGRCQPFRISGSLWLETGSLFAIW